MGVTTPSREVPRSEILYAKGHESKELIKKCELPPGWADLARQRSISRCCFSASRSTVGIWSNCSPTLLTTHIPLF